jgi:hypothetical protein
VTGEGCRWVYSIDLKFVLARFTFIFNLNFMLKTNFKKWLPIMCAIALDCSQETNFPQSVFCSRVFEFVLAHA